MLRVHYSVCTHIPTSLQCVAIEVLSPSCKFDGNWLLNAKQLFLKYTIYTHTHTQQCRLTQTQGTKQCLIKMTVFSTIQMNLKA